MRWLTLLIPPLLLAAAVAACDAPEDSFRLVTVESQDRLGLSLRELPEATLKSIGLGYGLAVIRVGREGERAGLRLGDVVYGVNETLIHNLQEFSSALAQPREGRLSLLVRRGKADRSGAARGRRAACRRRGLRMPRAGYRYSSAHLMIASLLGRSRQWRASCGAWLSSSFARPTWRPSPFGAGFAASVVVAARLLLRGLRPGRPCEREGRSQDRFFHGASFFA
jgi:hypothetical protein